MAQALAAPLPVARGPRIVAVALLSNLVSVGCGLTLFGIFLEPVSAELGIDKASAGLGYSLGQITGAVSSLVLGWWLLRRWLRPVLLVGALCVALGLLAMSRAESALHAALVFLTLLGVGSRFTGPLATSALVASWYTANRGRALGIASAGTTFGGALMPPIAALLIERFGWRNALALLAAGVGAFLIPIVWAWAVRRPDAPDPAPGAPPPDAPLELAAALRDPRFWMVALVFGFAFAGSVVMILFTVPYARQLGFTLQAGAWVMTGHALSGALGKIAFATLSDHVDRRWLLGGMLLASALLLELFLHARNPLEFALLAGAFGFLSSPLLPLQQIVVGAVFGREAFSQVLGLLAFVRLPLQLLAAPLFGWMLDVSDENYELAFRSYVGLFLLGASLIPFLRIPHPRAEAA